MYNCEGTHWIHKRAQEEMIRAMHLAWLCCLCAIALRKPANTNTSSEEKTLFTVFFFVLVFLLLSLLVLLLLRMSWHLILRCLLYPAPFVCTVYMFLYYFLFICSTYSICIYLVRFACLACNAYTHIHTEQIHTYTRLLYRYYNNDEWHRNRTT